MGVGPAELWKEKSVEKVLIEVLGNDTKQCNPRPSISSGPVPSTPNLLLKSFCRYRWISP